MKEEGGIIRKEERIGLEKKEMNLRKKRKKKNMEKENERRNLKERKLGNLRKGGKRDEIMIGGEIIGELIKEIGKEVGKIKKQRIELFYDRRGRRWRRGGINRYNLKKMY